MIEGQRCAAHGVDAHPRIDGFQVGIVHLLPKRPVHVLHGQIGRRKWRDADDGQSLAPNIFIRRKPEVAVPGGLQQRIDPLRVRFHQLDGGRLADDLRAVAVEVSAAQGGSHRRIDEDDAPVLAEVGSVLVFYASGIGIQILRHDRLERRHVGISQQQQLALLQAGRIDHAAALKKGELQMRNLHPGPLGNAVQQDEGVSAEYAHVALHADSALTHIRRGLHRDGGELLQNRAGAGRLGIPAQKPRQQLRIGSVPAALCGDRLPVGERFGPGRSGGDRCIVGRFFNLQPGIGSIDGKFFALQPGVRRIGSFLRPIDGKFFNPLPDIDGQFFALQPGIGSIGSFLRPIGSFHDRILLGLLGLALRLHAHALLQVADHALRERVQSILPRPLQQVQAALLLLLLPLDERLQGIRIRLHAGEELVVQARALGGGRIAAREDHGQAGFLQPAAIVLPHALPVPALQQVGKELRSLEHRFREDHLHAVQRMPVPPHVDDFLHAQLPQVPDIVAFDHSALDKGQANDERAAPEALQRALLAQAGRPAAAHPVDLHGPLRTDEAIAVRQAGRLVIFAQLLQRDPALVLIVVADHVRTDRRDPQRAVRVLHHDHTVGMDLNPLRGIALRTLHVHRLRCARGKLLRHPAHLPDVAELGKGHAVRIGQADVGQQLRRVHAHVLRLALPVRKGRLQPQAGPARSIRSDQAQRDALQRGCAQLLANEEILAGAAHAGARKQRNHVHAADVEALPEHLFAQLLAADRKCVVAVHEAHLVHADRPDDHGQVVQQIRDDLVRRGPARVVRPGMDALQRLKQQRVALHDHGDLRNVLLRKAHPVHDGALTVLLAVRVQRAHQLDVQLPDRISQ